MVVMTRLSVIAIVSLFAVFAAHIEASPVSRAAEQDSLTFVQDLDHVDSSNDKQWAQRIWKNDAHYKEDGPIFLRIGSNEAENADGIFNENAPIVKLAAETNALIFNMEMRFFGESHPTVSTADEYLPLLSATQSIGDVSRFIEATNADLNLQSPRWILFGTAYGGNIALWHRQSRPELTVGAWASSASVGAVFDYKNFTEHLKDIFGNYSATCADNIEDGFNQLHTLMQTPEGRIELDKGPFAEIINVAGICQEMERPAFNDVARIVNWVKKLQNVIFGDFKSLNIAFDAVMQLFKLTPYASPVREKRLQTWENCQEIGQMPSSNTDASIFGKLVPVDYFLSICQAVFGDTFTREYVEQKMANTMKTFGRPDEYKGKRVIASQGANDPMRDLGVSVPSSEGVLVRWIEGEASGADLQPIAPGPYSDTLQAFHKEAFDTIKSWLGN